MPLDNPGRSPHVRAANGQVGLRHLATLPVGADCPHTQPEIGGDV